MSKWLTVEEFADAVKRHEVTIRREIQAGVIKAEQRKPRAHYRIHESEVDRYIKAVA